VSRRVYLPASRILEGHVVVSGPFRHTVDSVDTVPHPDGVGTQIRAVMDGGAATIFYSPSERVTVEVPS